MDHVPTAESMSSLPELLVLLLRGRFFPALCVSSLFPLITPVYDQDREVDILVVSTSQKV